VSKVDLESNISVTFAAGYQFEKQKWMAEQVRKTLSIGRNILTHQKSDHESFLNHQQ
jgi:hypothetical protein